MKKILGIDIGTYQLKLVLLSGNTVLQTVVEQIPEQIMKDGKIVSMELMGAFLRRTLSENHIHCKEAAIVLPMDSYYLRTVSMPVMTQEQLRYNIQFEFHDYITDDIRNYMFDYALQSDRESLEEQEEMQILAAAIPRTIMDDLRFLLRKAGLRMVIASPDVCGFAALFAGSSTQDCRKEYAVLDLGNSSIRLHIFRGDVPKVTRVIERGIGEISTKNAQSVFSEISIDLLRAINFYRFSNPDSTLQDIYICGGGSRIPVFIENIRTTLNTMNIFMAQTLLDRKDGQEEMNTVFAAAAITQIQAGEA